MSFVRACVAYVLLIAAASSAWAAQISGEYIEARTCDVYTGPCFANGEIGIAGKEALMAWKVDRGTWNQVKLDGLSVALVVNASDTLGFNPSFAVLPDPVKAVVLVDSRATEAQKQALVAFVKESAPRLTKQIVKVDAVPMTLQNDHLSGKGMFAAGNLARIETRGVNKGDCVCTNEAVFYPPLTAVENSQPVYALRSGYQGEGLSGTWTTLGNRGAFMATFRR